MTASATTAPISLSMSASEDAGVWVTSMKDGVKDASIVSSASLTSLTGVLALSVRCSRDGVFCRDGVLAVDLAAAAELTRLKGDRSTFSSEPSAVTMSLTDLAVGFLFSLDDSDLMP